MSKNSKNKETVPESSISSDTKKAVAAVFLFAFSAIILISSFGIGGKLGNAIFNMLEFAFGWGAYVLALSLILAGILILKSLSSLACSTTIASIAVMFLSAVGIIQLIFGFSVSTGKASGGKLGLFIGASLEGMFGFPGSIIIILAFLCASILIMLNASLSTVWQKISPIKTSLMKNTQKEEFSAVNIKEANEANLADGKKESSWKAIKKIIGSGKNSSEENPEKNSDNFKPEEEKFSKRRIRFKDNEKNNQTEDSYKGFPLDILSPAASKKEGGLTSEDLSVTSNIIKKTLENFGISVEMKETNIGPTVTQYSLKPNEGIKLSRIVALQNDLALALAAHPIRIEAPIPGKSLVGIEVPNKSVAIVRLRNIIDNDKFKKSSEPLLIGLGLDVSGNSITADLAKMPHMLIAGSTGSGKSVCINALILSLLSKNSPKNLKLILVDPKRVELSVYNGIPHLLSPVIFDCHKTVSALKWAVKEMEERLKKLQDFGARDIASYNSGSPEEPMPYIIIIIDELADLMTGNSSNEVETGIVRIAQMARAAGIHLIVSTQRPSVEVITGLIKANISVRIAFRVASQIDSRTILDTSGSEKLLGNGDMLFLAGNQSKPKRIQCAFLTEEEVKKAVKYLIDNQEEKTDEENDSELENSIGKSISSRNNLDFSSAISSSSDLELGDSLYGEAKEMVRQTGKASASLLQRKFRIGYARAARLIDILEEQGIVGPADGARPREVFYNDGEKNDVNTKSFNSN